MKVTNLTDFEIWTSFKYGEEWAISFVYSKNAEKLYRYGLKFTDNYVLIEDALQDLFADLIRNRRTIGNTDNILLYLMKSFKHKVLRKLKHEKRFIYDINDEYYPFDLVWSAEHEFILKETSNQRSIVISNGLNNLTSRQKEAIYLKYTHELNYKDIAEVMEISVEACRNLIYKSIIQLRKWFQENKRKSSTRSL